MSKLGKWPVGGYAPGGYACCRCTTCDEYFMAAKRAYTCAECTIQNLLAERDALKAEVEMLRGAVVEAVYMLDPEAEDVLKGAGIYRIVSAHVAVGGVLPDDLKDALAQTSTQREGEA